MVFEIVRRVFLLFKSFFFIICGGGGLLLVAIQRRTLCIRIVTNFSFRNLQFSSTGVITTAVEFTDITYRQCYFGVIAHDLGSPQRSGSVGLVVVIDDALPYIPPPPIDGSRLPATIVRGDGSFSDGSTSAIVWFRNLGIVDESPMIVVYIGLTAGALVVIILVSTVLAKVCAFAESIMRNN